MRIARRLVRVEQESGQVRLHTDGVQVRVTFVGDDVLRLRAGFDEDWTEASYSLVTTAWEDRLDHVVGASRTRVEPGVLTLTETAEGVVVQGARLRVEVARDPFSLRVVDRDGTVLHEDVPGIGWREDLNGRRLHTSRMAEDDCFYGFGEQTGPLNRSGRRLRLAPSDAMGYDPEQTDPLYKHIPFYLRLGRGSRAAVGLFHHNTYECELDLGRSRSNYWPRHTTYRTDGGDIDLFVIAGPGVRDVLRRYARLTGTSAMLPRAALGYLGSSMYYSELPSGCDEAILGFVDRARRQGFPVDGFQLSSGYTQQETSVGLRRCVLTWNSERFPDPPGFFAAMGERAVMVSPNVKPGVLQVHPSAREMIDEGLFVRAPQQEEPAVGTWWGGPGHLVDFTSPTAREAWSRRLRSEVLATGTTSVWNDNCEYDSLVDLDARCDFDGAGGTVARLRTVMANLMCQVTVDAVEEQTPDARAFVVCRSGHAGIQRLAQTWSGDNRTSWEALRAGVATVLGMSLSGVANQGNDVGGFAGPAPDPELLVRWVQQGAFLPRFSIHSVNSDNTVTEPWMYGSVTDLVREAVLLRYRLLPYLYTLMARAHATGLPIVEPLCSAFQHDPATYDEGEVFMLGDLLVAPVVERGVTTRSVRLPEGEEFFDLWTREPVVGGRTVDVPVELGTIPLFLRAGGIVALADHPVGSAQDPVRVLRLVCAPQRDGELTLYEDDGATRAFERGEWLRTRVSMRAGQVVEITLTPEGPYRSTVQTLRLDVISPASAPFGVSVDGAEVPHLLDRDAFDAAEHGWHYDNDLRSVQVLLPRPASESVIRVSFEPLDLIGM